MGMIKLNSWAARRRFALLCIGLLLGGCGLTGRHGSLAAGVKYQSSGQYRAAYIEAKKILQHDDKNGDAWLLLGQASLMLGNPKDALSDLQNARANGVPQARWAVPMGRALLVTNQNDALLKTLSVDKPLEPAVKAQVEVLRGDAYRGLKQFDKAKQAYAAALVLEPKEARASVGLARLAEGAGDKDSANHYVQQALAAAPENPHAWVAKGDLAFLGADYAGAESDYQKVLDFKNPDWLPQERFYALGRLVDAQVRQNHLDRALANIETLEKMSPEQPFPHYLHAVVLYKQGHLDDAVSQLQQVLKAAPDNPQAQLLMGAVNYAQGNYGQAQMNLSNVLGVDQKSVPARKLLALTFYREGNSQQALNMLRPAAPGNATDAELLAVLQRAADEGAGMPQAKAPPPGSSRPPESPFARAGEALAGGSAAEAIRLLQQMPAGDAASEAQRNRMLVMAYVRDQHPDTAVKTAAAYAAKHPDDSDAHLVYGTALIADGKHDVARTQYDQATKLDPKNVAALLSLASLDSLEGHYKDASGRYQTVLKVDPHNAIAMTELGRLAAVQGDKASAIKWFKQAIATSPKAASPYIALVMLYSEGGQFEEAVGTARELADVNPGNPAALNALGAAELNAGHHGKALQPLQQAVKLAPQVSLYRINLARAQVLNKDGKGAEDNLEKVIKADPEQLQAVTLLAFLKLQDHDLAGALALAQTLQKQSAVASRTAGYALEGDLYMANKSYDKAAEAFQQGLKIQYDRPLVVKRFLALNASGAKQPDTVLRDWLAKHSDDAATRLLLAQYYMDHAQNKLAVEQYEQVLKAYPSNVDALNNLAWIYTGQHDPRALALAERAYRLASTSPGIMDTYGWALVAHDQPKVALPILEKAARAAPETLTIRYHLAVAQARSGDRVAARTTLEALQKTGASYPEKSAAEKLYQEVGGAKGNAGQ
ncbi:MAG: PEP-CTERM system TPR-repeat protein PrsT [Xanthomonadaceae bacterium]|nr:PEP-CTERM system TPR-repeat protein PrsT [Xanthomonadaceae bacterium]